MTNLPALTKREFTANFYSPMAYVIATFYLVFAGLSFYIILKDQRDANAMRSLVGFLGFIHTIFIPMVTMRLISEERKSGTLEMLVTAPVSDTEIAVSKFLGATFFTALMIAPTVLYAYVLRQMHARPDAGLIYASYVGLVLLSMAYIAIGLFISSLTANQIVAAILTFVVLFTFYFLMSFLAGSADSLPLHDKIPWADVASYARFDVHLQGFAKGLVDSRDVVYFLSVVVLGLFCTVKSLESRRWR